jgi:hypothetical protein
MILREVALPSQGTSTDLNFTHPVLVCKISLPFGVGTLGSSRRGGLNTEVISNPTMNPVKDHNKDIIIYYNVKNYIVICKKKAMS